MILPLFSRRLFSLICVCGLLAGCGGGGGDGQALARIQGTAFLPPGIDPAIGVANNAPVQVLDLGVAPGGNRLVQTSTTDANGRFDVTVPESRLVAVVVQGKAQVSGLLQANSNPKVDVAKDFNGATDIACRAGVSLIDDGIFTADAFDNERISNLEDAAALVVADGQVRFDDPRSVSNAVNVVLVATNNGDHPVNTGHN